jgi:hypothetical protein
MTMCDSLVDIHDSVQAVSDREHCAPTPSELFSDRLLYDGVCFEVYTASCFVQQQDTTAPD